MNEKVYCILCGAENSAADDVCCACGQPLDQKDTGLRDFITEKIKGKVTDEVKGSIIDKLLDWLKKLLNSRAYALLLTLSVVAGAGSILAGGSSGGAGAQTFANDVPGMFTDGNMYGGFSGDFGLQQSLQGVYGQHDVWIHDESSAYGDAQQNKGYYLVFRLREGSSYLVTVTDKAGKTVWKKQVDYDPVLNNYNAGTNRVYFIPQVECTIDVRALGTQEYESDSPHLIYTMNDTQRLAALEKYEADGTLRTRHEYYPNHHLKYSIVYYTEEIDGGAHRTATESYYADNEKREKYNYNEDQWVTVERSLIYDYNGAAEYESRRIEIQRTDATVNTTYYYDGVINTYYETIAAGSNAGARILNISYDQNGAEAGRVYTEYHENGNMAKATYVWPDSTEVYYYDENGDQIMD